MTLDQIKSQLNISTLELSFSTDKDNKPTSWLRHWDNDRRIAISIHLETARHAEIHTTSSLALQTETKTGSKGSYTAYRIVKHNSIPDMVL